MEEREEFLADVRHRLEQAQVIQKLHYDHITSKVNFAFVSKITPGKTSN